MPKAITPVNVTPALTGWQDVGITAHVGADSGNVRGAILHIANRTGAARAFGVRPKGATTTRTRNMADGWQAYQVVLVDGNDTFQVNCGSTSLEVYLIGYLLADEYNGLVNEVEVTPTEDGTYRTVDISAHVGSDTPIGAVLALDNGCGSTHPEVYIRAVGSTDDYYWRTWAQTNTLAIVKLDANKQFEARVGGSCVNLFLLGWITANANFVTNLTLHRPSQAGQYETIDLSSEVDADAVGVWWFRDPGDTFPADPETVKEAGSSYDDEWLLGIAAPAWGFTKLSALKEIEYRSADTDRTARIGVVADAVEGAADTGVTGSGDLSAGNASASGSGVSGSTGSGSPAAANATASGAGVTGSVGAGDLLSGAAAIEGVGTVADPAITGSGALLAGDAAVVGDGDTGSIGAGALQAGVAAVAGEGVSGSTGTGFLASQAGAAAGQGVSGSTGAGDLAAQPATAEGEGVTGSTGTGALQAGNAIVRGTAENIVTGSGALQAGQADAAGEGVTGSTGSGEIVAGDAAADGAGATGSTGQGAIIIDFAAVAGLGRSGSVGGGDLQAGSAVIVGFDVPPIAPGRITVTVSAATALTGSARLATGIATGLREVTGLEATESAA